MITNYNLMKENNLRQMVTEYENERFKKSWLASHDRAKRLNGLELSGLIKLEEYVLSEDAMINSINRNMINHYKQVFDQMVEKYSIFDIAVQEYTDDDQYVTDSGYKYRPITTKQQLRKIVNSFNNQHR